VEWIASRSGDAFFGYFLSLGQKVTRRLRRRNSPRQPSTTTQPHSDEPKNHPRPPKYAAPRCTTAPGAPACAEHEHRQLIDAIEQRDATRANALMAEHLEHIEGSLDLSMPDSGAPDFYSIFSKG
jgi:DNA-binding GntR family transcriptional regulator